MRKLLLLFAFFAFSLNSFAQTTIYAEDFDVMPYKVTNGVTTTGISPATIFWNDTTAQFTSAPNSYHVSGSFTGNEVWFETDSFSTVGWPYVFLSFNHICKLFLANEGRVEISTDGGNMWTVIPEHYYLGSDVSRSALYVANEYYNAGSYVIPSTGLNLWQSTTNGPVDPTMWVREQFDLRGIANDTTVTPVVGYADVRLRFTARYNFTTPPPALNFYEGWYMDSINVTGSICELRPPKINFTIPNQACLERPEQRQVETTDSLYTVTLLATDDGAGMDRVELIYTNKTTNVRDTIIMTNTAGAEYTADMFAVLGDTICWYVEAYDLSCPNITKSPVIGDYVFWVDSGLPSRCGAPYCGSLPTTISVDVLPWVEDFEGSEWIAGDNGLSVGSGNSLHRGQFPVFPDGYWVLGPAPNVTTELAWSIANGGTATNFTGPNGNHTPGGNNYLYTEGSTLTGNSARIITPCIDLTQNTKCLAFEFWYHMFGPGIKRLRVDVDTGNANGTEKWWTGYANIFGPQQNSSSDPWQKSIIGLEQFNGKFIRLRFHAVRENTAPTADKDKCDIAIDDFRIFEPDPAEIELLSFDLPLNGFCGYSATEPITVTVRNNGCATTSAIPLAFSVNGGTVQRDTIFASTAALALGDTTQYTFIPTADLSGFATYNIKAWSEMPGDLIPSNDTVNSVSILHDPSITTFPFIEDFEDGIVGQQDVGNTNWRFDDGLDPNFRWIVGEDMTSTRQTGPFRGYYRGGKYLYTETSGPGLAVSTFFRVLCIDLGGMTNPTLDFFYHFFGADITGMDVQVSLGNQDLETWTTIAGSNVGVGHTEERDDWLFKRVGLNAYAGQTIKLRFRANRSGGGTDLADMAIDKIMIYDRSATDAGAFRITRPDLSVLTYLGNPTKPKVDILNYGTTNLNSVDVTINVTPLCGPTAGVPMTHTETIAVNIAPGQTSEITMSNFALTWPVGEFNMEVFTSATGDNNSFNDTITHNAYGVARYDVPYFDNFDLCNSEAGGFVPNANSSDFLQWEFGAPAGNVISNAHSSPNAWVTNLDGNFLPFSDEVLNAPLMEGFDSLNSVELRFWHYMDFGLGSPASAAGVVEYRNAGAWEALGGQNINSSIGFNWLGSKFGTQNSQVFNGPAFEGNSTADGGWIFSSYPLNEFNNTSNTVFRSRFRFKSDHGITTPQNGTNEGWGIDDFELWVPGQHSASPIKVVTDAPLPIPGQDQTLIITLLNTGAKILDSCKVKVVIDGNTIGEDWYQMPPFMFKGQKTTITFNDLWPGNTVTSGVHEVCVITSMPNNRMDDIPLDDTICPNLTVLGEIDMTTSDSAEYCNDFERTDPNITPWIALNSNSFDEQHSWEHGTPIQFSPAHSGNNVWMTKLDSVYTNLDQSSLFTPIFILDSGVTYEMSFYHWLETEPFHDGGTVEVTFDGGLTWSTVGYKSAIDTNWYNTDFVTALDIIKPGWSDSTMTGQWSLADHRIGFQTQGVKAIFRLRFGADYDLNFPGWAIDDFCFKEVSTNPQIVIGQGEYQTPEQIVVADLSPNPTNSNAELAIYTPTPKSASITIVNSVGQLMMQREANLNFGVNRLDLDGSRWDSGIYIVKIDIEGESFTKKLIISK